MPVFDNLFEQDLFAFGSLHPTGDFSETGRFGCRVAAFAGDDSVLLTLVDKADSDRLQDAQAFDRRTEFVEVGGIDILAGLLRVGFDPIDVDQKRAGETASAGLIGRQGAVGIFNDLLRLAGEGFGGRVFCRLARAFASVRQTRRRIAGRWSRHGKRGNGA